MNEIAKLLHVGVEFLWAWLFILTHSAITFAIVIRVVMSNRSVGASLAWICVVFLFPILGPSIYLLIGELRLGSRRRRLVQRLEEPLARRYRVLDREDLVVDWKKAGFDFEMLARAGREMLRVPALPGNRFELFENWNSVFDRLIDDIDSAKVNCDLEFYIWHDAGRAKEIGDALIRASQRGVTCRVLVDAIGSLAFLRSSAAKAMRAAGVHIQAALPGGLWRLPFVRFDLRLHRKIVVIDDQFAWTGSLNLVDPRFFKQESQVGQWVDAMVRLEGPVVEALAITFQSDWYVETNSTAVDLPDVTGDQPIRNVGNTNIQVLPSGPAKRVEAIEMLLITAVYAARQEVIITTPYFVPSEALQSALSSAAWRGVEVTVVVPQKVDSALVRWASRAFISDLIESGVRFAEFHGGLLHTKSVTIDGRAALFGSLNMDPRSFRLNFEITLGVYDRLFASELRRLQHAYLAQSDYVDIDDWSKRTWLVRFGERAARLLGPLL
jgi:cardiolipin synthase